MNKNIGTIDKVIRVVVGSLIVGYGLFVGSYFLIVLGAIPLLTSLFGFCPMYALFGKTTCSIGDRECN